MRGVDILGPANKPILIVIMAIKIIMNRKYMR
jgi:hypothetical protein